jgi:nucleoside-diphosphate-sugar epimerase
MKVLLTGANGFVGSQILQTLCGRGIPTVVLLRPTSQRHLIAHCLHRAGVRLGSMSDPASLRGALEEVTHVIHCAGITKALHPGDFEEVNALGTRHLVAAANERGETLRRLILISSLAAHGPALTQNPAREDDPPAPVSTYGRSKLAAELAVKEGLQADYVILRPPAVYGPGDADFLRLFRTIRRHIRPRFNGGRQPLSLLYVRDLAEATLTCLEHPAASRQTYHVAHPDVVTATALGLEITRQMGVRAWTVPLPNAALWPVCLLQEGIARLTGKPAILSRDRYRELSAPGWVCDSTRLRVQTGFVSPTPVSEGIALTAAWYRQHGWL